MIEWRREQGCIKWDLKFDLIAESSPHSRIVQKVMYDTTWSHTAAKGYKNPFPLKFNII